MEYAYKVTTHGRAVMAACMALEKPFHTMRVAFGSGKVDVNTNLADVHQLLEYVSEGAIADRRHQDDRFCLTIQYANQQHPDVQTFLLSEFIVYVEDPETGEETDLLYGTLGDYRQPVPAYNPAYPPSVFNFPLELVLSSELQVLNSIPAGIATWDDLSKALGDITPISNSGIPTSSTAGTVGQTYINTDSGTVYTCIAAAMGESGETNYTWVPGKLGTLADIRAALHEVSATLSQKADVEPLTWYDLPLTEGYNLLSGSALYGRVKYSRDQFGTVYVTGGRIGSFNNDGSYNPTILNSLVFSVVPAGFRPGKNIRYPAVVSTTNSIAPAFFDIGYTGHMQIHYESSTTKYGEIILPPMVFQAGN